MVRRLSGLLVLLLLWDFAAAPAGASALDRGYDALNLSGFTGDIDQKLELGKLWVSFQEALGARGAG